MGIGMQELLIILVIVLLIFGANKLPEIGGGLGRAIRNFRRASTEPDEIDITGKSKAGQTEQKPETASVSGNAGATNTTQSREEVRA